VRLARRQWLASLTMALAVAAYLEGSPSLAVEPKGAAEMRPVTGTVRAVDLEHRTLDLVTGVGYALRIERVEIPAGVTVKGAGKGATLSSVTDGCIVRVGCHHATAGMVASTLELIERPSPAPHPRSAP
jgi:hypothetical protein